MLTSLPIVMCLLFIGSLAIALAVTPLSIKLAPKIGAVDAPKARGMHKKTMPRFGGMGIFAASMAAILLFVPLKEPMTVGATTILPESGLVGVLIAGTWMYLVGVIDDIRGLSAKVKLAGQIISALILFFFDVRFSSITNPFSGQQIFFPWVVSLVLTVVWVVGITNTINLIDGLDGLAGGISAIASLCAAYTAYVHGWYLVPMVFVILAGGCAGFLAYNFHPAKTFMGDSGALFLGFMLASVSMLNPVKTTALTSTLVPIFILALPIFDTVFAILRRAVNGRPIMEADKGHLHHRIMMVGMGQKRTVLTLYSVSIVLGVSGILISRGLWKDSVPLLLAVGLLIYAFMGKEEEKGLKLSDFAMFRKRGAPDAEKGAEKEEAQPPAEAEEKEQKE